MNGTPHHKVIEGLVQGKERSIGLLQQAIRALQEKLDDDFPAPSVGPKGPPLQDHNAEMRPHGPIPADATSLGEITLDARLQVLDPPEVRFELLQARVALLEAALSAPRPAGTVGMGHNRGPELDAPAEIEEIDRFIALLKEQTPTTPTDRSKLLEAAQVADQKAKGGREYLDELAKGVIKGGSEEIGKRLVQSPWWIAVYAQLDSVVPRRNSLA